MHKAIKPILFLFSGGVLGWGGWSIYSSQTPKTLGELVTWKGYVLASADDGNIWKFIYEENKDAIGKDTEIQALSGTKNEEKIKTWCTNNKDLAADQVKKETLDKAILYCTNNPKTVKGKLISQGKDLAGTEDDDYKVSATLFSGSEAFSKLISKSNDDKNQWHSELKTWCETTLAKHPNESRNDVELAGKWCLKQNKKTLKDRIQSNSSGKNLVEISDSGSENGYETKFEEKKNFQTFLDALNMKLEESADSETITSSYDKSKGKERLKKFCDHFKPKNIWEIDNYFNVYSLVGTYCYKETSA